MGQNFSASSGVSCSLVVMNVVFMASSCPPQPPPGGWDRAGRVSQHRSTNTEYSFFIVGSNSLQGRLPFHVPAYIAASHYLIHLPEETSHPLHSFPAWPCCCLRVPRGWHADRRGRPAFPGRSLSEGPGPHRALLRLFLLLFEPAAS